MHIVNHPPLYKRAANGAIRKWQIRVRKLLTGEYVIERYAGQLGGVYNLVSEEKISEGKNIGRANETTVEEQALSEAESKWKKQLDGGFKTLKMIGCSEEYQLDRFLPKYNTDAQGNVKPMLAQKIVWEKLKYPVLVQPKFDGVRCLLHLRNGEVAFYSRSGKPYTTLGHIEIDCMNFLANNDDVNIILDGEVYAHDIDFQSLISAVKAQSDVSLDLKFQAYDIVDPNTPQITRLIKLNEIVEAIGSNFIRAVETKVAQSREDVMKWFSDYTRDGFEGAMVRLRAAGYKPGVRSSSLLKVKEFDEGEFEIVGGKVNKLHIYNSDCPTDDEIDSFTFVCKDEAGTFDPKPMGSREKRAEYMRDLPNLIGKKLTVKHFGWTNDNHPRFPIGKTVRDYE